MLPNCRDDFSGDYGVWMKLAKLLTFCKVEWPTFNVGWPTEGALDLATTTHVRDIVIGDSGHPDQFPYVDSWYILAAGPPDWLHFHTPQRHTAILVNGKVKRNLRSTTPQNLSCQTHHNMFLQCTSPPQLPRDPESNSEGPNGKEEALELNPRHVIQQLPC
jgi:hypothetical protein